MKLTAFIFMEAKSLLLDYGTLEVGTSHGEIQFF